LSVKGVAVSLNEPAASRAAGILRLFQTPQVYKELTCMENVLLSTPDRAMSGLVGAWMARPAMWRREHQRWEAAAATLERVGLGPLAGTSAAMLPYGQQRLLDLARALAAEPVALLLDEPSAGLNQFETERLAELCNELRTDGLSLMVIDHKVDFIEAISDRVAVLELGRLIASGTAAEVWRDARVMEAYLGLTSSA
jgi:ABC-type branched-subunit amino acid transport system ATPase component